MSLNLFMFNAISLLKSPSTKKSLSMILLNVLTSSSDKSFILVSGFISALANISLAVALPIPYI